WGPKRSGKMRPAQLWAARCVWESHLRTEAEGRPESVVRRQRDRRRGENAGTAATRQPRARAK
ncbi:G Antigen 12H, partial [Manis pentadactyla]